jgi:hypothetical protein
MKKWFFNDFEEAPILTPRYQMPFPKNRRFKPRESHPKICWLLMAHRINLPAAGREPPDPRKGSNPTSLLNNDNRTSIVPPVCGSGRSLQNAL